MFLIKLNLPTPYSLGKSILKTFIPEFNPKNLTPPPPPGDAPPSSLLDSKESNYVKERK
jgi:hypothetical protein